MKAFIYILTILLSLTLFSSVSYAQYSRPKPVTFSSNAVPFVPQSFLDLDGYKSAQSNIKSGKTTFWSGLGCAALGGGLIALAPVITETHTSYARDGVEYIYDSVSGWGGVFCVAGGLLSITGTICMIHGAWKWCFWEREASNIRFSWYITHNGFAVSF